MLHCIDDINISDNQLNYVNTQFDLSYIIIRTKNNEQIDLGIDKLKRV